MRMTIVKKMGLGMGTLLVIFVAFGIVLYFLTLNINKNIENIIYLEEPTNSVAYEMEINLVEIGVTLFSYLHDHDPKHLERINKDRKDFEDFQKRYDELADTEDEKKSGLKIKQRYDEYIALIYELIRIEDEQTRKIDLLRKRLNEMDDILDDNLQALIKTDDPQAIQKIKTTYGMEINTYEIFSRMSEFLQTHSDLAEARIHRDEQDFREYFKEYKNLKLTSEERQLIAKTDNLFDESIGFIKDIVTMDKTKEKRLEKLVQMREELDNIIDDEIQADTYADITQAKKGTINSVHNSHVYGGIAFLLSLVVGGLGTVLITRSITRPVRQLVAGMEIVARGDLSSRIEVKTEDEIGYLTGTFNKMVEELQRTTVSRDYVENILNSMGESLIVVSRDGRIEKVNPATCDLLGYREDELIGQSYQKVLIDEDLNIEIPIKDGITSAESVYLLKNNESIPVRLIVSAIKDKNGLSTGNIFIARDITERKQREKALKESEERFRTLISNAPFSIWTCNREGTITYANQAAFDLFGVIDPAQIIGQYNIWNSSIDAEKPLLANFERAYNGEVVQYEQGLDMTTVKYETERKNTVHFISTVYPLPSEKGQKPEIVVLQEDISGRKRAEEKIFHQMKRLTALQTIDMTITSTLDLRLTLNIFLDQATEILKADAASILTFNPYTQMLRYAASRGFLTPALQYTTLHVGEGHAGLAALERRFISIPNLIENPGEFSRSDLLVKEGFVSYYAVPLIAKGQVMGVLEIFHRTPLIYEQEMMDLLTTLGAQAAIAIDNITLFENLQRSNIDLIVAYDTTLKGWSRALDYRDKETEGHSQRVTEMTLEIGRILGIDEKELVNIRRGALLHDIGKLGIPDSILLKPERLTDEEWVIMKKHPVIAYEILSPIAFLRPAIDIPYCHHEKWNGTGYPRGLKGEQIPLSARIFAVVDVWDTLHSERPYRPAWSKEKIIEYIRSLSGIEFDPKVVEVFLKMDFQY